jgi:NADPH-dependent ferric siderophore reductase
MLRVTLSVPDGFVSGGRDQRIKLFLPHPGQDAPLVPAEAGEEWFTAWRAMDPAERAVMRSYTVRRRSPGSFDIDFAMHGDGGPASRWAAAAQPGDRAAILGATRAENAGFDFRPPASAGWILLAGDEAALPAIGGILDWLPPGTPVRTWIEVPREADRDAELPPGVTWLYRDAGQALLTAIPDVPDDDLPPGTPYAWIAGESATVRALRRHLVNERGLDRKSVTFTGYWRRGAAEEDLLAEALAGATPQTEE